jgi:hypothetical protein
VHQVFTVLWRDNYDDSNPIAGYTYETNDISRSSLTLEDLNLLKQTVLFKGHSNEVGNE